MHRVITVLVVLISLLCISIPASAVDWDSKRAQQCRFQYVDRRTWSPREEKLTAKCLVQKWSVPGGLTKLNSVISCESGWGRFAYNPSGPYVGLAQHALRYWEVRLHTFEPKHWDLKDRWWNSRSHLTVTVRMVHRVGWGPWSCA